jgi:methylglutaconyl-CoA hydratase
VACESTAQFGLPETTLGIVPGAGGTQRLSRLIGVSRAQEMIYTGQRIDCRTAYQYGLIQHMVSDVGMALPLAMDLAWNIAANGPMAVQASKYAIHHGLYNTNTIEDALDVEGYAYDQILQTKDRIEGLKAFQEKRKPYYHGH